MLHAKRDKSAAGARRRQLWQQRLAAARAAYADTLANMDRWEALYNGSRRLTDADGRPARDSSNVRNIAYELVESQVDSTLPLPRVEAIHAEDTELARSIEAVLRHQIQLRGLADLNDLQERTVPIQGGSFWLVEWDPKGGGHCTLGQLSVTPLHPRQVIPQPGVCDIEKMDYLFIQMAQTKQSIYKRYGVDVSDYNFSRLPASFRESNPQQVRETLTEIRDTANQISTRMYRALEQNRAPKVKEQER